MVNQCVAAGCTNKHRDGVSLFKFPQDPDLRKQWIAQVKRTRDKWTGPTKHSVLCSIHFTDDCFDKSMEKYGLKQKPQLKKNAVPTIFKRPRDVPCSSGVSCSENVMKKDECGPQAKKRRTAIAKRNRKKIINELLVDNTCDETDMSIDDNDDEVDLTFQTDHSEYSEVSTQTSQVESKSIAVGTERVITKSVGTKTIKLTLKNATTETQPVHKISVGVSTDKVRTVDVGIQVCTPVKCTGTQTINLSMNPQEIIAPSSDNLSECSQETSSSLPSHATTSEYEDSENSIETPDVSTNSILHDTKYIVFETALLLLFQYCPVCNLDTSVAKQVIGTYLKVVQTCKSCNYKRSWESQPIINNTPAGNILLSGAILFSGALPTLTIRVLENMNCATIVPRTFYNHQKKFLTLAVSSIWMKHQTDITESLKKSKRPLIIGGDGRCDSPGHSAKFGSYTVMDLETKNIIDVELVQSNEVKSSYHMELEGLIRAIDCIHDEGLVIKTLVTDRHTQISKWARENLSESDHRYDVWHLAKSLRKKIEKVCKRKGCEIIAEWMKSIINHLYWCAISTQSGDGNIIRAKWLSVANHMHDIHHHDNEHFPECAHSPIYGRRKWLKPHTEASEKICAVVSNTRFCNDISKMSPRYQTSSLEAFHSVVNQFAPKSRSFSYEGMLARLYIAAIHYNENKDREQALTKPGDPRYSIEFPKYKKGGHIVRKILCNPTYNYVEELFEELFKSVKSSHYNELPSPPPPLCSQYDHPEKDTAVSAFQSRFHL